MATWNGLIVCCKSECKYGGPLGPECHQKKIFHNRETLFFFSFPARLCGETRRRKGVHGYISGWKILENGNQTAFSSKSFG